MFDDDDTRKKLRDIEIGQDLSLLSIDELEERITILHGEIERIREAITQKTAVKGAADALFKS